MFGIKRVLLAAVVGGGGVYFADHYHVVHTVDGVVIVPRAQQIPLRTAYADVRGWDATKWAQYPELSESLLEDGRGGLLIDGTVDGVLEQLGERIGLTDGAHATGSNSSETTRPPIVFGTPSAAGIPSSPEAAPADESLLGRLSRQLQGATTTGSALETRPMIRAVPQLETAPLQPAFQPTQPAFTNERAEISPQPLPQDILPSIHSAAMQRITTEIGSRTAPASGGWTPTMDPIQTIVSGAIASPAVPPTSAAISTPSLPTAPIPQFNASGDAANFPLNLDASRLRESLPTTIQQELLKGLHTEPSAGLDPSVFRSF